MFSKFKIFCLFIHCILTSFLFSSEITTSIQNNFITENIENSENNTNTDDNVMVYLFYRFFYKGIELNRLIDEDNRICAINRNMSGLGIVFLSQINHKTQDKDIFKKYNSFKLYGELGGNKALYQFAILGGRRYLKNLSSKFNLFFELLGGLEFIEFIPDEEEGENSSLMLLFEPLFGFEYMLKKYNSIGFDIGYKVTTKTKTWVDDSLEDKSYDYCGVFYECFYKFK